MLNNTQSWTRVVSAGFHSRLIRSQIMRFIHFYGEVFINSKATFILLLLMRSYGPEGPWLYGPLARNHNGLWPVNRVHLRANLESLGSPTMRVGWIIFINQPKIQDLNISVIPYKRNLSYWLVTSDRSLVADSTRCRPISQSKLRDISNETQKVRPRAFLRTFVL